MNVSIAWIRRTSSTLVNKSVPLCLLLAVSAFGATRPPPSASTLTTWVTQIVPLVIVGEGWSQRIIFQNVDKTTASIGTLSFYTQDGKPWSVDLKGRSRASTFLVNLQPGQSAIYETNVQGGSQVLGWASMQLTTAGVGDLFGQMVFRKQTANTPDFMCSMILGGYTYDKLLAFFDNTEGKYTGMAILTSAICVLSSCPAVQLRVMVKDMNGGTISTKTISQKPGVLYWMNLSNDFPETRNQMGSFTVEPVTAFSTRLTGFSLEFAPNGAFTAVTPFEQ